MPWGAADLAEVAVERGGWLHEVRGMCGRLGLVLGQARLVGEVHGHDLRGLGGCEPAGLVDCHGVTDVELDDIVDQRAPLRCVVVQDAGA